MAESENIFLTEKQVAEKYQVSTRTLHNLRKNGKLEIGIQYFYLGKQIRYKSNELQEYFETSTLTY
jgi:predicted site-specific integrase-resolvase|tara:strand:+ start:87 stop:284 length:198 start_codon:yes stop_codon:yes gene_type:complete